MHLGSLGFGTRIVAHRVLLGTVPWGKENMEQGKGNLEDREVERELGQY